MPNSTLHTSHVDSIELYLGLIGMKIAARVSDIEAAASALLREDI